MTDNSRAVLWALVATALYSAAAALAKLAAERFPVLEILFFRQLVLLASTLPGMARDFPGSLITRRAGLHAVRLGGAFVGLACGL